MAGRPASPPAVAVAYSAGRDSTALLHATACAARSLGLRVAALHVHHGLSTQADAWLAHAYAQCAAWAQAGLPVELLVRRVQLRRGGSVEARAREARYAALAAMAQECGADIVLLAHHQRDQAETFLLQALRGAGAAGLAAMPRSIVRDGLTWARPWLDRPREAIEAYVSAQGLSYVDDDSNTDDRFARNRLRLRVWPALEQAFPDAQTTLADAAARAQDAAQILGDVAQADLQTLGVDLAAPSRTAFPLRAAQALGVARLRNALRVWFNATARKAMPPSLLERVVQEGADTHAAHWPAPGGVLRLYRGTLRFEAAPIRGHSGPAMQPEPEAELSIRRAGRYRLPGWGGTLEVTRVPQGGVALSGLAACSLRARRGAEQFQSHAQGMPRALKKQFQAAGVPAWAREGPLVYSGGHLVFVPGLGLDARALAEPGQPQVTLSWVPAVHSPAD